MFHLLFPAPDLQTVRLCSMLASVAYAGIFLFLWSRRREGRYMLHWGTSSAIYAGTLIGFQILAGTTPPLLTGILFGLIALSTMMLLTGVRSLDHERPFMPWMAIPVVLTFLGVTVPLLFADDNPNGVLAVTSRLLGAIGVASCMILCGCEMMRARGRYGTLPRRIAGMALLAYVPACAVSIASEFWEPIRINLQLLPMLSDQAMLGILYTSLLAVPWERALRQLEESTLHDSLTNVWNRAALKQKEGAFTLPTSSLFLIDIDHFKRINDTFGHAAGDAVLCAFSERVDALANARNGIFVRLGGDEFVMVAPTASDTEARTLGEQVRIIPPYAGLPCYSVSVGIARVADGETGLSPAMARADRSLYRAKAGGRDRVRV